MKNKSYVRAVGVFLLACPLALALLAEGTAATLVDPVSLGGVIDFDYGVDAIPLASFHIEAVAIGAPAFTATRYVSGAPLLAGSPNYGSFLVEGGREYDLTSTTTFNTTEDVTHRLEVLREGVSVATAEESHPPVDFNYDLARISGNISAFGTQGNNVAITSFTLEATGIHTGREELYESYYRRVPEPPVVVTPNANSTFDFYAVPETTNATGTVTGAVEITGTVSIRAAQADGTTYSQLVYILPPRQVDLWDGGANDAIAVNWDIPVPIPVAQPSGANITGTFSSVLVAATDFTRHRVRGSVLGVSSSSYSSAYSNDPTAANYSFTNRNDGIHRIYTESQWHYTGPTSRYRMLRRPYVEEPIGTANPFTWNFNDELAEIRYQLHLGSFYAPDDFTTFYVEADGPRLGSSRDYIDDADGHVNLPVTRETWSPNELYARIYRAGDIDATFRAFDFSYNGIQINDDIVPVEDYDIALYRAPLFFDIPGQQIQEVQVWGDSVTFDGCDIDTDPRYFDATGVDDPSPNYQVDLVAAAGCYRYNASATTQAGTRVTWSDLPLRIDGQECTAGVVCELQPTVTAQFFDDDGNPISIDVTVVESPLGPPAPANFGYGPHVSGNYFKYYELQAVGTFGSAEVCFSWEPGALEAGDPVTGEPYCPPDVVETRYLPHYPEEEPSLAQFLAYQECISDTLRLFHYNTRDPLFPLDRWHDITTSVELYEDYSGTICGETTSFSPFAVFRDADLDDDSVLDAEDNCAMVANPEQDDSDGDGQGDACDAPLDDDGDGIGNNIDICPDVADPEQADSDGDGIGDACDDSDGDGVLDLEDDCPLLVDGEQLDADGDGIGDACDDSDGDGVLDVADNCPVLANDTQADTDEDGVGDACDDSDGDGVLDVADNCPVLANPSQGDADGDGLGDACDTGVCEGSCSAACPCDVGEGDCDDATECMPGLMCLRDAGVAFGYEDPEIDVCSAVCPNVGVGAGNYCSAECPCEAGEGDCDDASECMPGLMCLRDAGVAFGYEDPELDVCSAVCPEVGVGAGNYCFPGCPCDAGEGDCDRTSDCAPGLVCASNVGASYGLPADTDVCEAP